MGYTTEFTGHLVLSALPPAEVIVALRNLEGDDGSKRTDGAPTSYCHWQLTRDCMGIEWDGGEKFYDYVEWLQFIVDKILAPAGLTLSGQLEFDGEDSKDNGTISVVDGKVVREENSVVIKDLKAFKDFVLASDHGNDILHDYLRKTRR